MVGDSFVGTILGLDKRRIGGCFFYKYMLYTKNSLFHFFFFHYSLTANTMSKCYFVDRLGIYIIRIQDLELNRY